MAEEANKAEESEHPGAELNKRGRKRELRKEQLIEVATHLFAKYGLEGTTTKDIAREAGVSPGLMYHYYPSKEALLVDVVQMFESSNSIDPIAAKVAGMPLTEGLPIIVQELSDYFEAHRELVWLIMRAAARFPVVEATLEKLKSQSRNTLAEYFDSRMKAGEMMNIDTRRLAVGLTNTIAFEHLCQLTSRDDNNSLVRAILYGIVAPGKK